MSTQLDELLIEMLAHVALFLDRSSGTYCKTDNGLLALRSVSRAGLDAVRRAIKSHPTNEVHFHSTSDARKSQPSGTYWAAGARRLEYQGALNNQSVPPRCSTHSGFSLS